MKTFLLTLVLGVLVLGAWAEGGSETQTQTQGQGRGRQRRELVESQKVAFLTDRLALTPAESEKFWPLYKQYWAEEVALAHEKRRLFGRMSDPGVTAVVAEADLALLVALEHKRAELIERYGPIFATALPWPKVVRFFAEQEKFKVHLLRNHVKK